MEKKLLYNTQGVDSLDETMIGGNPSGLLNFNKSRYKWAASLYKVMRDCFWTPESVNTATEGKAFKQLNEDEQFAYRRVFARLSFIDSLIADTIADNVNAFVTNKVVNACLIEQAAQEVLHSKSYAVLLADAIENSDEVFELYKTDLTLNAINTEINNMFSGLRDIESVTPEDIYYAMVANQIAEGILFQTGFATIYFLQEKMVASASMIAEIHKDENNHIALFENIIREIQKENPDGLGDTPWFVIRGKTNAMFEKAYKIERSWMRYVLGYAFTEEVTDATVAYFIKKRMQGISMYDSEEDPYGHGYETPLVKALNQRSNGNDTKGNFFEVNVANYSKQELVFEDDMDYTVDENEPNWCLTQPTYEEAIKRDTKVIDIEDRSGECVGCQ